jgi:hypothetical protein
MASGGALRVLSHLGQRKLIVGRLRCGAYLELLVVATE